MNTASQNLVQVGVSMVLRDNFTKEAGRISQSFRSMMADMDTLTRGYKSSFGDISEIGMNLVGSMYDAYKYSAGVQNEIWLTSKIAGANIKEAKELWDVAQQVNKETPLTAAQVASAERYLAMAGNSARDIKNLIGPASKLASIFGIDPGGKGGLADMMTNIMAMFQIDTSKASGVVDDLYTAVTNANMSMEDLMATIRYSGADMNAAGVSLREVAAAAGALGDVGIQGTMAGTSLGNMMRYFQLSISGQKKYGFETLAKWGLGREDFYDAQGNFLGLGNFLQKFYDIYQKMTPLQRTQDFYNIFSVRGMRALIPMLESIAAGNDKFLKIMNKYDENQGVVERVNQERLSTNAGLIDQFESSIENLIATFGKSSEGPWRGLLTVGTELVDNLREFIETDFGAKATSYAVGMIITATVWATLKGILAFVSNISQYTQTLRIATTETAVNTKVGPEIIRLRLISLENNMINGHRNIVELLARLNGMGVNKGGYWMVTDPTKYGKTKNGKAAKRGQFAGGKPAGTVIIDDGYGSQQPNPNPSGGTTTVSRFGKWGTRLGKLTGYLGKGLNYATAALMAYQTLEFILNLNTDAVKENTDALKENEEKERQRREELWYNAIKQGVIDGMRSGKLNLNVNSTDPNIDVSGGEFEYGGAALLGL